MVRDSTQTLTEYIFEQTAEKAKGVKDFRKGSTAACRYNAKGRGDTSANKGGTAIIRPLMSIALVKGLFVLKGE